MYFLDYHFKVNDKLFHIKKTMYTLNHTWAHKHPLYLGVTIDDMMVGCMGVACRINAKIRGSS